MAAPPSRNAPCPCGSGRKYKNCCMPRSRPRIGEAPLTGVPDLTGRAWDLQIFPLPTSVDEEPGRRLSVVLVAAEGFVLHHDLLTDPLGRMEDVVDALDAAVAKAEQRAGVRPTVVRVRHAEVARSLSVRLAPRDVEVRRARRLPELEEAARGLVHGLVGMEVLPLLSSAPTWRGWGLSASQCRALFAAAARFYRARPWERLGEEPISVLRPTGLWTVSVMGSAGEEYGLSIYTHLRDFLELEEHLEDMGSFVENLEGAMISLSFEPRKELPREMQREVASAGWEVADHDAYPFILATNTPAGGLDPDTVDGIIAMLVALPAFADALAGGLAEGKGGQRITWEHAATHLHLSVDLEGSFEWPVPARLTPCGPVGEGADPAALTAEGEGPDDEAPDQPWVDAFLASLRAAVSEATALRHARHAAELVEFLNGRQGVPLRAMNEHDLRTFLYDEYPRHRPGYARSETLPTSLRKFFAFVAEHHHVRFPWAEPLLRDRGSLLRRVEAAPRGGWWDPDVQDFRADVWEDLDRRGLLLPDNWSGALEPEAFMGMEEARLQREAQRAWLVWRDELILEGTDTPDALRDALGERLLEWLDAPDAGDTEGPPGRTRLDVLRAERKALPPERRRELERAFLGEDEGTWEDDDAWDEKDVEGDWM